MIKNVQNIVKKLQKTSKNTDKIVILKQHENDENWKKYLKYVLDDKYVYGIQQKKLDKFLREESVTFPFNNLFDVFEYLLDGNNTGSDNTVRLVASYINSHPEEEREFYIQSITKKIKMGIDTTVNKVYKGLLSEFKVMLAKDFYKESHKAEGKSFILTEKLDGMRVICIHDTNKTEFFSRKGQPILQLDEINQDMQKLEYGVYDGELLIKNEDSYKDRDVLQNTLKISRKDGIKNGLNFWVFDYLPIEEFESGTSTLTYKSFR